MYDQFKPGELFVYCNGDRWELGKVKHPNNTGDGYFCYYSIGDTASNTPVECMHKLDNAGWSPAERTCTYDLSHEDPEIIIFRCSNCGGGMHFRPLYCPCCGSKVVNE